MLGMLHVSVEVPTFELLRELGERLGIDDYTHLVSHLNEQDSVMRQDGMAMIQTNIDPEIFKAFIKIKEFFKEKEKEDNNHEQTYGKI